MNELADRIELLEKSDAEEKARRPARAAANKATEEYVSELLDLRRELYDKIEGEVRRPGRRPAVTQAIEEFNKDADRKLALGPTSGFLSAGRKLKENLETSCFRSRSKSRHGEGDLWYVSVVFNGKYAEEILGRYRLLGDRPARQDGQGGRPHARAPTRPWCELRPGRRPAW